MEKCKICGKECKNEKSLKLHMEQHENGIIGDDGKVIDKRPRKNEQDRGERIPVGTPLMKLTVSGDVDEDYHPHWFIDKGGRIDAAKKGGYTLVNADNVNVGEGLDPNSDLGSAVSQVVGTNEDGSPQRAYLMQIRKDWYEEDQAEKEAKIKEVETAIAEGRHSNSTGKHGYIPSGGIEIGRET